MTRVPKSMKTEFIPGDCRYVRLLEDFYVCLDTLGRWVGPPAGFVFDLESIPLLRSDNPEAGCIHDYLSRSDSDPCVTTYTAALCYYEVQDYFDSQEKGGIIKRAFKRVWRYAKIVAVVAATKTYFHKKKVMDSYEVIKNA